MNVYNLNVIIKLKDDGTWAYSFEYANYVYSDSGYTSEYAALKGLGARLQKENLGRA